MAERDPIWSVPDNLSGTGPWRGWADDILDEIELDAEGDPWDGHPLVLAWICSSVVEARRRKARALLAAWGSRRLGDMVCLLDHMARVDDPQVLEDVVVAALGAASGAPFDDEALVPLAMTVDRLFFRDDAEAWTPDVIVRVAARGIVERVALLCPGAVDYLLKRVRPPYEPRGPYWPELDVDEAREYSSISGKIVWGDLSWYVADHCFSPFLMERRERCVEQEEDLLASVDKDVMDAVLAGRLTMPEEVVQRCRAIVEQRNQRTQQSEIASDNFLQTLRELYAQEVTEQGEPLDTLDEKGLLRWAMERYGSEDAPHECKPQWSDELRALCAHASQVAGVADIEPDAVRDALIAAKVHSWGWSEVGFCCYDWDKLPERVDQAIVKRHGAGASHGSRSAVATFREKYVWAAVNCVAGELADRLPVWDEMTNSWRRLDRLERLGTRMPDPLPRSAPDSPPVPATDRRLQGYYRMRRLRLAHAIDAMAKRIASVCRLHKVGEVVIGWPKGILLETTANAKWQRLRHGFWSFDTVATRVAQALQRVGIHTARVGERGTSSHCPTCGSAAVVRAPRHVLRCHDCRLMIHADQAASRNMIRQKHPQVSWAGLEASLRPHTFRWSRHRWCVVSNPAI